MTNQEKIISADCFPNLRRGFNLPWLPSTEKQLTGLSFFTKSLSCIPHTHYVFSTPAEILYCALTRSQAKATGRLQSLSTGSRPQPSLAWKSISTAHPLVLPEEQFKQTLNEPMLTLRMCLKFEVSCKSGRLTQCHLTISQFTSNQWQWPGTQKNQWMLGLLPILHCWHKPQTTGNDSVDRWNRNKPNATQQSC